MKEKADSIEECDPIEDIWKIQIPDKNISVTTDRLQLSHSDVGPYIHVFCSEGQHVVGPTMVTCLKGGKWDDVTVPYCSASAYYGIAMSNMVIIGVVAGCAAIVIFTLTTVLAHLLCFRRLGKLSSRDPLGQSNESIPSTSASFTPKTRHCVSDPTCATRNGVPLIYVTSDNRRHDYSTRGCYEVTSSTSTYNENSDEFDIISSYNDNLTSPYCTTMLDHVSEQAPPPPPPLHENIGTSRSGLYKGQSYPDRGCQNVRASYQDSSYQDRGNHNGSASYHDSSYQEVGGIRNDSAYSNDAYVHDPLRNYAARWDNELRTSRTQSLSVPDVYVRPVYSTPGRTVL